MARKKVYLTFNSKKSFESFFKRKTSPILEDEIEYCILNHYNSNRILFTAEHANSKTFRMKKDKSIVINVGDRNTDILAKIGSFHLLSAYIFPHFNRIDADAARDPRDLGKGLVLFTRVCSNKSKIKVVYVPIHRNKQYYQKLIKYHSIIESLNPKAIISVHGIHAQRKFDFLLGFGGDYACIGGKKNAFLFKRMFIQRLKDAFEEVGLKFDLKIGVSTWRWTGSKNYVLNKHVIQHNRKNKMKRIGVQIEMNYRGRVSSNNFPSKEYQIGIQVLGETMLYWLKTILQ